jgi:endogenous inhibitor of DNA gyrase (YacG/DUF329 family)
MSFLDPIPMTFRCLCCGRAVGVHPETARIPALCSRCQKANLPVHQGWSKGATPK